MSTPRRCVDPSCTSGFIDHASSSSITQPRRNPESNSTIDAVTMPTPSGTATLRTHPHHFTWLSKSAAMVRSSHFICPAKAFRSFGKFFRDNATRSKIGGGPRLVRPNLHLAMAYLGEMGSVTGKSGRVEMTTAVAAGTAGVVMVVRMFGASRIKSLVAGGLAAASMTASNHRRMAEVGSPRGNS